jgi:hypothetical protein
MFMMKIESPVILGPLGDAGTGSRSSTLFSSSLPPFATPATGTATCLFSAVFVAAAPLSSMLTNQLPAQRSA